MANWKLISDTVLNDWWAWTKFVLEWILYYLAYMTENPVKPNEANLVIECYNALGFDWVN